MIKLVLTEIVEAIDGYLPAAIRPVSVVGISTDSRTVRTGELFFALRGEHFDGHQFVDEALQRGAVAAVVSADGITSATRGPTTNLDRPLIVVDEPLVALARLARFHRRQLAAQVIAVVGSNGKTTTKAMIDHILSGRMQGCASPGSYNNAIGVPITLLSADLSDEYLVVEIGTNQPGEVAELGAIVEPELAVVTCIAEEHLEGLGSLDGVAREECAILHALPPGGFAAVNIDQTIIDHHLPRSGLSVTTFGRSRDAALRITYARYDEPWLHFTLNSRFDYRLPMPGAHNAVNAAGAIAVALRLGLRHEEIVVRLEKFTTPPMRNEVVQVGGVTVLNDAYNANPHSAIAALDALLTLPCAGRRFVVFGEMRELGAQSPALHRKVALRLADAGYDRVFLVGRAADHMHETLTGSELFTAHLTVCPTIDDCRAQLLDEVRDGDVVLLKASRTIGLERLIEPLRERTASPSTG